jgi:hypothetical protein
VLLRVDRSSLNRVWNLGRSGGHSCESCRKDMSHQNEGGLIVHFCFNVNKNLTKYFASPLWHRIAFSLPLL